MSPAVTLDSAALAMAERASHAEGRLRRVRIMLADRLRAAAHDEEMPERLRDELLALLGDVWRVSGEVFEQLGECR